MSDRLAGAGSATGEMDSQTLERALRTTLDEVAKDHVIIKQLKKDRDELRERIRWLSDRALFFELASATQGVLLTEEGYGALLAARPDDQTSWASFCASAGADPAGGITLEQFSNLRSDPHGDLQALADLPVIRRAVRTASEATPVPASLPDLTAEKRRQLEHNVDGVLKEIVKTERDYVEAMREVVEDFYRPLLDSSFSVEGAIVDSEDVHKIFGAHYYKLTVACSHSLSQSNTAPYFWMIRECGGHPADLGGAPGGAAHARRGRGSAQGLGHLPQHGVRVQAVQPLHQPLREGIGGTPQRCAEQ